MKETHTLSVEPSKTQQNAGYQSGRSRWPFFVMVVDQVTLSKDVS